MKVCSKCKVEKPKTEFNIHRSKTDGLRCHCKSCMAEYRESNREKLAKYREANRERIAAYKLEYRSANAENIATYNAANREKKAAQAAKYRAANPEKFAAQQAAYIAANPDKRAARVRNRRARKRKAEGKHSSADVRAIFEAQRGLCANCQTKLFESGKQKYHVDHIMPLALGGSNWPSNLQCLCPTCNLSKWAKHPDDWAKQQGRLL